MLRIFKKICFFSLIFYPAITTLSIDMKIYRIGSTGAENTCMVQDKDGLLWISTEGRGLYYYDGEKLKKAQIIDNKDTIQIVSSIFVDSDGLIWFYVQSQGLYSYSKKTGQYKIYKSEEGNLNSLTSNSVNWLSNTITEDKEGFIWFGTTEGLNCINKKNGQITQYKHINNNPNTLSNSNIWTVFVGGDGTLWVGTDGGLNYYNKKTKNFKYYKHNPDNQNSLSDNSVRAIAEDKNGNLWIGTKRAGIDKLDLHIKQFTNYRHDPHNENSVSDNEIHHIMVDRNNNLWICNEKQTGIDFYDNSTNIFKHYRYHPQRNSTISSDNVLYSMEGTSGIIWIATSGGINKCIFQNNVFKNYLHDSNNSFSISSNDVAKVYEDKNKNIWIGTYKGGVCLYTTKGKFEKFTHVDNNISLPGTTVYSILDAPGDQLWLGAAHGTITLFDTKKKQVIKNFENPYSTWTPCFLTQDCQKQDIIWFASYYPGSLFSFNTKSGIFTPFKHISNDINSWSNQSIFDLLQDNDFLWAASGGDGLIKFNKKSGKCTYYKHDPNDQNSISGNIVIGIFIDSKKNFWLTTDDGGLNKFDRKTGKFTSYGTECGFPSKSTRHILEDKNGLLWISTDLGIVKFDPKIQKVVKIFTTADGLASDNFNRVGNPIIDSNGNFWFTGMGLCEFDPNEANNILPNSYVPFLTLTSLKTETTEYNNIGFKNFTNIKLAWPDNSFEFEFAVLDYMEPDKNHYAYVLEGFDKHWNYIGTNHFGKYTNLAPGKYVLHLKGANNDGLWNEKGASLNITVMPAFWMTLWFKILMGIAIVIIIFVMLRIRAQFIRKQAILFSLEKHNIELAREIEERKKAETKLAEATAIQHKMELDNERDRAIAETASHVAHDVKRPFTKLQGILAILPNLTLEQIKKCADDVDINFRKITAMFDDITELSRTEAYNLEAGNILTVLDLAIKNISHCNPDKKVNFYYDLEPVPLINLDQQRMCRAFDNIIANAFDAMLEPNSFMWFSVHQVDHSAIEIIIGNSHSHIPSDKLGIIFKNKYTFGKRKGTGLGLGIVQKVIGGHGGSIFARNVISPPGFVPDSIKHISGVEFVLKLASINIPGYFPKDPVLKNSEEARTVFGMIVKKSQLARASEINQLTDKLKAQEEKPSLLILDDESIYRVRIRNVLEKLDSFNNYIHTYDASSYKEIIELINHAQIDYMICDIDLGDKQNNGFLALTEVLQKYPNCKVLMHTNRKDPEDIKQAKKLGACGFCPKPITEAILVDLLLKKDLWSEIRESGLGTRDSGKTLNDKLQVVNGELLTVNETKYIDAVPNSSVLFVNDDNIHLQLINVMFKAHINHDDNVSVYSALSYNGAVKIIDKEKIDLLICDFNLETEKTGLDVCKHLKSKNSDAVCVISSNIGDKERQNLVMQNKNIIACVMPAIQSPADIAFAFNYLKEKFSKRCGGIKEISQDQAFNELVRYAISIVFPEIEELTKDIQKAPELVGDIEKFKTEFAFVINKMDEMKIRAYALSHYVDTNTIPLKTANIDITMIDRLLNSIKDPQKNSEIRQKYLQFLEFFRHDIIGSITVVKSFFTGVDYLSKTMSDIERFAKNNVRKQEGINEGIKTLVDILKRSQNPFDLKSAKFQMMETIKKVDPPRKI